MAEKDGRERRRNWLYRFLPAGMPKIQGETWKCKQRKKMKTEGGTALGMCTLRKTIRVWGDETKWCSICAALSLSPRDQSITIARSQEDSNNTTHTHAYSAKLQGGGEGENARLYINTSHTEHVSEVC